MSYSPARHHLVPSQLPIHMCDRPSVRPSVRTVFRPSSRPSICIKLIRHLRTTPFPFNRTRFFSVSRRDRRLSNDGGGVAGGVAGGTRTLFDLYNSIKSINIHLESPQIVPAAAQPWHPPRRSHGGRCMGCRPRPAALSENRKRHPYQHKCVIV